MWALTMDLGEMPGSAYEEIFFLVLGFPCGSAGKESTCNAEELGLIPVLERLLEKGKTTYSCILAWRIP